jgi:subtilisin family serine protease
MQGEPLASYRGSLAGLAATAPRAIGLAKLDARSLNSQRYLAHLNARQLAFATQLRGAIPTARVLHRYQAVLNGVAVSVPVTRISRLAALPGVAAIYEDKLLRLQTDASPAFIGAPAVWTQLAGQDKAGEGVIIGVLDSGIWPEHPSLSNPDAGGKAYPPPPGPPRACEFGLGALPGPAFTCNNKLIGARRFMATYDAQVGLLPTEFTSARDDNGHGTHTATTAGGNRQVAASISGRSLGLVTGVAPRAHIMVYKVCGEQGCYSSDSAAAVNQAILDGVDVINFSISGGGEPYSDPVSLAFLDAYEAGVFVAASAGNAGPTADTVDHREPWTTTVAASTSNRQFQATVSLRASNNATQVLTGASIMTGLPTPASVVVPTDTFCQSPFAPGSVAGKVVVCQRGINARVAKGFNVLQGGAVGMILVNPSLQGLGTDNHFLPTVHLENDAGAALTAFLTANAGVTATLSSGMAMPAVGDVMAPFSSRGGPGMSLGIAKPDVTAPGVQVLAGQTPTLAVSEAGPQGELFQAIQGTSMSSPHVAGAAALLKHLHPDWTPGQIKSALMTTATGNVRKEDGSTPATPFDTGSGRIDLTKAGNPGLLFDESRANFVALQGRLWEANYPSLYVPAFLGQITVQRRVQNTRNTSRQWRLAVLGPPDLKVTVPVSLTVPALGTAAFDITVDGSGIELGGTRHAVVELRRMGEATLRFPVTVVRRAASVPLAQSCVPSQIPLNGTTACTITLSNSTNQDASVALSEVLPNDRLQLVPGSVVNATPAGNGLTYSGVLAGTSPFGVNVAAGTSPAGYLPLSTFGVAPIAGVGDETITNFNVPAFRYGGVLRTRIGLTSNGYAIVGGGTSADVQFVNQSLPSAAAPNNVLAPFWTDLNPAAGGAMRISILTDGVRSWIVLEWDAVKEYSSSKTASFQVWIQTASLGEEDITFTYGTIQGNGDGGFLTVGAENDLGTRGANRYLNGTGTLPAAGTELRVTTTPGAPGGTRTIGFSAKGTSEGAWKTCALMDSSAYFGTQTACSSGSVTSQQP